MEDKIVSCPQCSTSNRLKPSTENSAPVCGKCKSPLPWIVEGTDIRFRKELEVPIPVLVDFWAEWCAPCRMTTPVLEGFARDQAGQIKIVKLNIDQNPATAEQFNVRSIPTLILFKNGRPIETIVGAMSRDALRERLQPYLT